MVFLFLPKKDLKRIIVTGTSRGIGYELAFQVANAGHEVLALSRNIPQVLMQHEKISCLSVDLSQTQDLQQVGDFLSTGWKSVDAIVHNAGALLLKPFSETTVRTRIRLEPVNVAPPTGSRSSRTGGDASTTGTSNV